MFGTRSSAQHSSKPSWPSKLRGWVPQGSALPEDVWAQRHRGIVIVGRVLGGWSEVDDAIREGSADGFRRSEVLGRNAQLIASDKAQQRAAGARDELRVSPVHWATN